jgi:hypothetical protein
MNADGLSAPILLGLANGLLQNAEERMPVLRVGERRGWTSRTPDRNREDYGSPINAQDLLSNLVKAARVVSPDRAAWRR